jgi:uncharacterized membrane protein YdfJ with MMPL/SSD domain
MPRPISTRTHGALDYAWVSVAASAARAADASGATARLVRSSSVVAGINSMLTDYEAGMLRLMPMRVHLAVDFVIGAALVLSPLFLPKSGRRSVALSVALGLTACAASLLTDARGRKREVAFAPSYELSEAVVDPDIARRPHLRSHLE